MYLIYYIVSIKQLTRELHSFSLGDFFFNFRFDTFSGPYKTEALVSLQP